MDEGVVMEEDVVTTGGSGPWARKWSLVKELVTGGGSGGRWRKW